MNRRIIRLLSIMLVLAMAFSLTTPAYASDSTENGAAVTETAGNDNPAGGDPDDRDYAGDSPDDEDPAAGDPEYEEPGDADAGEDDPGDADPADGSGGRDPADGEEDPDVSAQAADGSDGIPEEPAEPEEDELSVAGEYQGSVHTVRVTFVSTTSAGIEYSWSIGEYGFLVRIHVSTNPDMSNAQAYLSGDLAAGNVTTQMTVDNLSPATTYYYRAQLIHASDGVLVAEEEEIKSFVTERSWDTCGDDLCWVFNAEKGLLTISGTGDMDAYLTADEVPWAKWSAEIRSVKIESGATGIGSFAFSGCVSLTSISIPVSVLVIGEEAFGGCDALAAIYYDGTEEEWTDITIEEGNSVLTDGSAERCYPGVPARTEFATDAELRACLAALNPFAQTTLYYIGEDDPFVIEQDLDFSPLSGSVYMNKKGLSIPEGVTVAAGNVTVNSIASLYLDGTLISGKMSPSWVHFGENSRIFVCGVLSGFFGMDDLPHITIDTESDYAYLNWDLGVGSEEELRRAFALLPSLRKTYCTLTLRSADEISLSGDLMIPEFNGQFVLNAATLVIPAGVTVISDMDVYLNPAGWLAVDGTLVNNGSVYIYDHDFAGGVYTNGGGRITGSGRIRIRAPQDYSVETVFYGFNPGDFVIHDLRNDGRVGAVLLYPKTDADILHFVDEESLREIVTNWTPGTKRVEYENDAVLWLTEDLVLPEGLQLHMNNRVLQVAEEANVSGLSVTAASHLIVVGTLALDCVSGKTEINIQGTLNNRGFMEVPENGRLSVDGVLNNTGTIDLQGIFITGSNGHYTGDGAIRIPRTGSYASDFAAHVIGQDPDSFSVESTGNEWELVQISFPTDRHWVYSLGAALDENGYPMLSGT